jgi:hypothetical protein
VPEKIDEKEKITPEKTSAPSPPAALLQLDETEDDPVASLLSSLEDP